MLLDKYCKHNGAQFLVLQIIISSITQFHKIIIYCMIEIEESNMYMKTKKFKREFKKSLVSLCRKENRQYLMILQFIAYYRFFQPILVSALNFCILFHFFYVGCFNLCFYSIQHLGERFFYTPGF